MRTGLVSTLARSGAAASSGAGDRIASSASVPIWSLIGGRADAVDPWISPACSDALLAHWARQGWSASKAPVCAAIIALVGAIHGLRLRPDAEDPGHAHSRRVVIADLPVDRHGHAWFRFSPGACGGLIRAFGVEFGGKVACA